MRILAVLPLLVVVACGGEAEEKKSAAKAASLTAGQYELTSEVTAFTAVDQGEPAINTPVGTRATETVCVGQGRPPTKLFAGEGYRCAYDNYYLRNGRLNVTLRCTREGLSGGTPMAIDGRFEAESFEYTRDLSTILAGDGDVRISSRVTGRRTGECAPDSEGDNQTGNQAG